MKTNNVITIVCAGFSLAVCMLLGAIFGTAGNAAPAQLSSTHVTQTVGD